MSDSDDEEENAREVCIELVRVVETLFPATTNKVCRVRIEYSEEIREHAGFTVEVEPVQPTAPSSQRRRRPSLR